LHHQGNDVAILIDTYLLYNSSTEYVKLANEIYFSKFLFQRKITEIIFYLIGR